MNSSINRATEQQDIEQIEMYARSLSDEDRLIFLHHLQTLLRLESEQG